MTKNSIIEFLRDVNNEVKNLKRPELKDYENYSKFSDAENDYLRKCKRKYRAIIELILEREENNGNKS